MKRFVVLAALLISSLGSAGGSPLDWKITGGFKPGVGNRQVLLVIGDKQVANARLGNQTTLTGQYQDHDIDVRCKVVAYPTVACDVFADGSALKTVYFDLRLLR